MTSEPNPPEPRSPRRSSAPRAAGLVALAMAVALLATTRVKLGGAWYGLFLLERASGRPLELADDLKLGDGPRLIGGVGFAWLHDLVRPASGQPRIDVDWDAETGGGVLTSHLGDGVILQTLFGRYVDDEGQTPRGLFVGGAIPEVAAVKTQNQSGMALRDARGWHHVWCNVNEAMLDHASGRMIYPGQWKFGGSRLLVDAPDRVVIQSEHELDLGADHLRMERYAYFKAGRPFFRLGINIVNLGERSVKLSYAYGDEPWVGEFGSSAGNLGWTERGLVPVVAGIGTREEHWAGIVDTDSGIANFMSWAGATPPDVVYFGNHPGTPRPEEVGAPLTSNEVFIGAEWRDRTIEPGETFGLRLVIGLAALRRDGAPTLPDGVLNPR